jgi:hypothetical protein
MAEIVTADHATQAGHWYQKDGSPAYTIIGKNGKERTTTLRDARKLGLVPSVTTIIGCASSPALTNWKIDQAILSALTLGRLEEETEKEYLDRIKADAQEQAKKAAERGTQIHAWVQEGFEGKPVALAGTKYFTRAYHEVLEQTKVNDWICEKPFATEKIRRQMRFAQRTISARHKNYRQTSCRPEIMGISFYAVGGVS